MFLVTVGSDDATMNNDDGDEDNAAGKICTEKSRLAGS